jgi:hypothetical protein
MYVFLFFVLPIYAPIAFGITWLRHFLKKYTKLGPEWLAESPGAHLRKEMDVLLEVYMFGFTWRWKEETTAEQKDKCLVDSSTTFPTFVYQPLPVNPEAHLIRVLELLPGMWDSPIRCKINQVSLNDDPKYEAISYHVSDVQSPSQVRLITFLLQVGRSKLETPGVYQ